MKTINYTLLFLCFCIVTVLAANADDKAVTDGPYLFFGDDKQHLRASWVCEGYQVSSLIPMEKQTLVGCNDTVHLSELAFEESLIHLVLLPRIGLNPSLILDGTFFFIFFGLSILLCTSDLARMTLKLAILTRSALGLNCFVPLLSFPILSPSPLPSLSGSPVTKSQNNALTDIKKNLNIHLL